MTAPHLPGLGGIGIQHRPHNDERDTDSGYMQAVVFCGEGMPQFVHGLGGDQCDREDRQAFERIEVGEGGEEYLPLAGHQVKTQQHQAQQQ